MSKIEIKNSGNTYKIGDELVFNDAGTTGFGAAGKVSLLDGRGVESVVSTELIINGTEFLPDGKGFYSVESSSPHTFDNLDIISVSGMSTTSSRIEGSYTIGVTCPLLPEITEIAGLLFRFITSSSPYPTPVFSK